MPALFIAADLRLIGFRGSKGLLRGYEGYSGVSRGPRPKRVRQN